MIAKMERFRSWRACPQIKRMDSRGAQELTQIRFDCLVPRYTLFCKWLVVEPMRLIQHARAESPRRFRGLRAFSSELNYDNSPTCGIYHEIARKGKDYQEIRSQYSVLEL